MLIACRFKRPKAPVELPGKTYFFAPVDPANPDSEHVADVTDPQHIQRLLSITEAYYIADAASLPVVAKAPAPSTPPAGDTQPPAPPASTELSGSQASTGAESTPSATTAPPSDSPPAGQPDANSQQPVTGSNELAALPEELEEQAKNLNELSWQGLKAQLAKGGIPRAVIQRALDIEKAKKDADQRATTLKILTQELESKAS